MTILTEYARAKARKRANLYYQENRKAVLAKRKAEYKRGESADYSRKQGIKWKAEVHKLLGNQCKDCGNTDSRVLQVDHCLGSGSRTTKNWKSRSRYNYYRMIALSPDIKKHFQLLCANCNIIKRINKNEQNQWMV